MAASALCECEILSIALGGEISPWSRSDHKHKSGKVHELDVADKNDLSTASSLGYFTEQVQNTIQIIDDSLMIVRSLSTMSVKISLFSSKSIVIWQAALDVLGHRRRWEGTGNSSFPVVVSWWCWVDIKWQLVVSVLEEGCRLCTVTAERMEIYVLEVLVDLYMNIFHEMNLQAPRKELSA